MVMGGDRDQDGEGIGDDGVGDVVVVVDDARG